MSDIALSGGIRSSLSSLKSTSDLLETTTERLSSGKKVNSAVDNPTNYFAADNYNSRADSLDGRLDGMSEAVQQINAADNGVTSIKSYLSQMKGIINNALSNTESSERQSLGKQYNELIVQIRDISKDSSYGGINLLYNNASTTVQFGENIGDSTLVLQGFNISANDTSLNDGEVVGSSLMANASGVASNASDVTAYAASLGVEAGAAAGALTGGAAADLVSTGGAWMAAVAYYNSLDADGSGGVALGETTGATIVKASNFASATAFAADSDQISNFTGNSVVVASYNATAYSQAAFDAASKASYDAEYANYTAYALSIDLDGKDAVGIKSAGIAADGASVDDWEIDWGSTNYQDDLSDLIKGIETLESTLQTQSSQLANNLAIITERQDYTENSIDILETGADNLTLADMDEEGANLLSLQTSSSLATQALSISSSQAQNVLQILQ